MSSGEVLRVISISQGLESGKLPSDIMGIEDNYTAFCFDEACAFIVMRLKNGDEIIRKEEKVKSYSKPSDYYKKFD